jgi:hypothetical protein
MQTVNGNMKMYQPAQKPATGKAANISTRNHTAKARGYIKVRALIIRARICKRYGGQESIPPAYQAWRAGTTNRVIVPARWAGNRFLGSFKGLKIRALLATASLTPNVLSATVSRFFEHWRKRGWKVTFLKSRLFTDFLEQCLKT